MRVKIAARQWGVNFCRGALRCLAGPSGLPLILACNSEALTFAPFRGRKFHPKKKKNIHPNLKSSPEQAFPDIFCRSPDLSRELFQKNRVNGVFFLVFQDFEWVFGPVPLTLTLGVQIRIILLKTRPHHVSRFLQ